MQHNEKMIEFYQEQLPGGAIEGSILKVSCPFCEKRGHKKIGKLVVYLNGRSHLNGYFRCLSRCVPGGFAPHFARLKGLDPAMVPGFDPEREPYASAEEWPLKTMNQEIDRQHGTLSPDIRQYFAARGIGVETLNELKIGFNGRYLVYPYFRENDCCYAAHCISPERASDQFWLGEASFSTGGRQIFNLKDIERCEEGAIFVVEGEENLLCLREMGFPGVAVPAVVDLEALDIRRFDNVKTVFLVMRNSPESDVGARAFAARLGFKARILQWPAHRKRDFDLTRLALEDLPGFKAEVTRMIGASRAYSPFRSPAREYELFCDDLAHHRSAGYQSMQTGLSRLDRAMGGLHDLNVIGGPPKSGKSCLAQQIATELASKRLPVIYYDFENGHQKIYQRTLARMSRLTVDKFTGGELAGDERERFEAAKESLKEMLDCFRVVNDRKLTPEIMRRHIDFLRHETGSEDAVVVIDSLHKLPFKDFAERRTGIDAWLRELESIRDELNVAFLVISELNRQEGGSYDTTPHMGLFKGSGDIEYTADNALIFQPESRVEEIKSETDRINALWLVASREYSPGLIGRYRLDFPFWGFTEIDEV
jgi:KaiC/GvpD/RAD55 family RecA-like ATPase